MRRWPTISWEEISHQKPNPAGLDLGLPVSTTMNNKFLSHPVYDILLWQPEKTHTQRKGDEGRKGTQFPVDSYSR